MKNVLLISATNLNFQKFPPLHRRAQFLGLSRGMRVYVLARGAPFHKKIWNVDFYLMPPTFLYWPFAFFTAFYLCLAKRIDTVVCQSPLMEGFVGFLLKKILRKELIIEIHGDWVDGPFLSKKRRFEKIQRKLVPILANLSLKRADKIRAISNYTKEQALKTSGPKPLFVFPTFTDINTFLGERDARFGNFILFVGGLEEVKGVDVLLGAFARIARQFPDFKLVLVGDGSERKNLRLQASSFKLQERVEFKGRLSLEGTKEIMRNCYCLVLPSRSEGFGRVLIEAMALSKPLIGSRVGGIPELIIDGRNGLLCEVGNAESLAEKLRALLEDRDLAVELGKRGRALVEDKFSNEQYAKNHIEMINS